LKKKSQLNFVNFVVTKFQFDKKELNLEENSFEITPQAVINRNENQFHINLELEILDSKNDFILKMLCVGVFDYNVDDDETLLNFMSINGPAIIFPYMRGFVSNFTALSGFNTVTLPTLNLSGFKEDLIKNLIDLDKIDE